MSLHLILTSQRLQGKSPCQWPSRHTVRQGPLLCAGCCGLHWTLRRKDSSRLRVCKAAFPSLGTNALFSVYFFTSPSSFFDPEQPHCPPIEGLLPDVFGTGGIFTMKAFQLSNPESSSGLMEMWWSPHHPQANSRTAQDVHHFRPNRKEEPSICSAECQRTEEKCVWDLHVRQPLTWI